MKLSISNIAWDAAYDSEVYEMLKDKGFSAIEIAPTRIFPDAPYNKLREAKDWSCEIMDNYGLSISSMQSIWYGKQEKIFGTEVERKILLDYTKKAIDFAEAIGCGNLVFGCPRNRTIPDGMNDEIAVFFFKEVGIYANDHKICLAIEANPAIYNTNYINRTEDALDLVRRVGETGVRINLDMGTVIENQESIESLRKCIPFVNHVHISEPNLKPIQKRKENKELADLLKECDYKGFVSIEMKKQEDILAVQNAIDYVREVFC